MTCFCLIFIWFPLRHFQTHIRILVFFRGKSIFLPNRVQFGDGAGIKLVIFPFSICLFPCGKGPTAFMTTYRLSFLASYPLFHVPCLMSHVFTHDVDFSIFLSSDVSGI